jgi:hypothetical protein
MPWLFATHPEKEGDYTAAIRLSEEAMKQGWHGGIGKLVSSAANVNLPREMQRSV